MARTAFTVEMSSSTPYTVPAGKHVVFTARLSDWGGASGTSTFMVDGVPFGRLSSPGVGSGSHAPLTAASGQVVSASGPGAVKYALNGFIYDI